MRVEHTRTIDSPAGIVWLLLADSAHQGKWFPGLIESNINGLKGTWTLRWRGRRVSHRLEITAQEPERRYAIALSAGILPEEWTLRCSYDLESRKNETQLRSTWQLESESFSLKYWALWPVVKLAGAILMKRSIDHMQRLAEEAAYVK